MTLIFTVQQISDHVQGKLLGDPTIVIARLNQFDDSHAGDLTFIGNASFAKRWGDCTASAALVGQDCVTDELLPGDDGALIVVPDADLAMAKVLALYEPPMAMTGLPTVGNRLDTDKDADANAVDDDCGDGGQAKIHPSACVDETAQLGDGVCVGAYAIIGANVTVGKGTIVHANVMLFDDCCVGAKCVLWPGTVIRERCVVGDGCIFHVNVSIGADGFGYRPDPATGGLAKVPQIGNVVIGNDVEIGANSCVDRGKFSSTVIGDGCKIDNLCQIGHNCQLGKCVILIAQVGVAGSTTICDGAIIGGAAGIADHITIGPRTKVAALSGVMTDVPADEYYVGIPARPYRECFTEIAALKKLPKLLKEWKRFKKDLEKQDQREKEEN